MTERETGVKSQERMSEDTSYHHLYYSAHADPVEELEKLTKPQPCIKLQSPVRVESQPSRDR